MTESVKVSVRVRPLSRREVQRNCVCVVSMEDVTTIVNTKPPKRFTCDGAYWSYDSESEDYATQEQVTAEIGGSILQNAFGGYNGCLFAYGQTGSGKTYSLLGEDNSPGMIPWTVREMFVEKARLEQEEDKQVRIWVSYLEIYNDYLYDLLEVDKEKPALRPALRRGSTSTSELGSGAEKLMVRDHPKFGVFVPGLNQVPCETPEEVRRLLAFGTRRRAMAATAMNDHSSRSHAVFVVKIQQVDPPSQQPVKTLKSMRLKSTATIATQKGGEGDSGNELHSRINLVDLAGAERQSKVQAEGLVMKQGCAINKGLSALALVIKELSDRQTKKGATAGGIPFRASKLTWLLKDSLAGNSKTHMLANISPACESMSETISTLRFATSVKAIKTVATQNRCCRDELVSSLRREIEQLRIQALGQPPQQQQQQLVEREKLMAELTRDYAQQIEQAKQMQAARDEVLTQMAVSAEGLHAAFGVDGETPYLMNMATCPSLAGCLLYYLPIGEKRAVGSADSNEICLSGLGIPDLLCTIENKDNQNLMLHRSGEAGRLALNGQPISLTASASLKDGDRLSLGRAVQLRLAVPLMHSKDGDSQGHAASLVLQDLEDEVFGIEDSPSWTSLQDYLVHVVQHMPNEQARALCELVRRAARMCDEANELTAACRPELTAKFEVRLTSGTPASVLLCMMKPGGHEPRTNWTVNQMSERLERMREAYQVYVRTRYTDLDPLDDPWVEVHPGDVWARVRDLEVRLENACMENNVLETKNAGAVARAIMIWTGNRGDGVVRIAFARWARVSLKSPAARARRRQVAMTRMRSKMSMNNKMSMNARASMTNKMSMNPRSSMTNRMSMSPTGTHGGKMVGQQSTRMARSPSRMPASRLQTQKEEVDVEKPEKPEREQSEKPEKPEKPEKAAKEAKSAGSQPSRSPAAMTPTATPPATTPTHTPAQAKRAVPTPSRNLQFSTNSRGSDTEGRTTFGGSPRSSVSGSRGSEKADASSKAACSPAVEDESDPTASRFGYIEQESLAAQSSEMQEIQDDKVVLGEARRTCVGEGGQAAPQEVSGVPESSSEPAVARKSANLSREHSFVEPEPELPTSDPAVLKLEGFASCNSDVNGAWAPGSPGLVVRCSTRGSSPQRALTTPSSPHRSFMRPTSRPGSVMFAQGVTQPLCEPVTMQPCLAMSARRASLSAAPTASTTPTKVGLMRSFTMPPRKPEAQVVPPQKRQVAQVAVEMAGGHAAGPPPSSRMRSASPIHLAQPAPAFGGACSVPVEPVATTALAAALHTRHRRGEVRAASPRAASPVGELHFFPSARHHQVVNQPPPVGSARVSISAASSRVASPCSYVAAAACSSAAPSPRAMAPSIVVGRVHSAELAPAPPLTLNRLPRCPSAASVHAATSPQVSPRIGSAVSDPRSRMISHTPPQPLSRLREAGKLWGNVPWTAQGKPGVAKAPAQSIARVSVPSPRNPH